MCLIISSSSNHRVSDARKGGEEEDVSACLAHSSLFRQSSNANLSPNANHHHSSLFCLSSKASAHKTAAVVCFHCQSVSPPTTWVPSLLANLESGVLSIHAYVMGNLQGCHPALERDFVQMKISTIPTSSYCVENRICLFIAFGPTG